MFAPMILSSLITIVALASSCLSSVTYAQLRVYDRSKGQNINVSGTNPAETPATSTTVTPASGGLRMAPKPAGVLTGRPVNNAANTLTPSAQNATPARVAGVRAPAVARREQGLGTVLVFIKGVDFSSQIATRVVEIKRVPGLNSRIFLQDDTPRGLVALANGSLKNLPPGVDFDVDIDGRMAQKHNVTGKNAMVYRDPSGAVRQYNLLTEHASFMNQVSRLRGL